jgi:O-acetyl-ADP-ribose deacetylase (regulator of RNase III)
MSAAYLIITSGDATKPISHPAIIAHVCNDLGAWGRGFVLAISQRWTTPETNYRNWANGRTAQPFTLGEVQFCDAAPDIVVANMLAQHGLRNASNPVPLNYEALRTCLRAVFKRAAATERTVHMPRIGCGLAGGNWNQVYQLIYEQVATSRVMTFIYT